MAAPSTFLVWAESLESMSYYDILRVRFDASPKEIQRAFHDLSLKSNLRPWLDPATLARPWE